jgi:phytoene synthase
MTTGVWSWEPSLWRLAEQGSRRRSPDGAGGGVGRVDLASAYALADEVTRRHSRSFSLASALLPRTSRQAIRSLYAFCRFTDDIVDGANTTSAISDLELWRNGAVRSLGDEAAQVMAAWRDTQSRYAIPEGYADQLIAGVAMDLTHTRYSSFDELAVYAYRVASTVGLMSMHILGFRGPDAIPYAIKMGVALQLTNILRDVGEDWRMGRLYLPLDELAEFGVVEDDIARGRVTGAWRTYMRFAIERNRQLYEQAWPGLDLLSAHGRRSVGAAAELYSGILNAIEDLDYDVFNHRAHLNRWQKLRRLGVALAPMPVQISGRASPAGQITEEAAARVRRTAVGQDLITRGSSSA